MTGPARNASSTSTPTLARASAPGGSATTRRCWRSSPAPTSPAASTPAIRSRSGAPARGAVARGVAIGAQVSYRDLAGLRPPGDDRARRTSWRPRCSTRSPPWTAWPGRRAAASATSSRTARCTTGPSRIRSRRRRSRPRSAATTPRLPLLTLPGSALATAAADVRLPVVAEAFADRAYRDDGTLVPRGEPGAVLTDPAGRRGASVVEMVVRRHRPVGVRRRAAAAARVRSACTATRQAPSAWPAPSAQRSSRQA